jgi:hypothetical protein
VPSWAYVASNQVIAIEKGAWVVGYVVGQVEIVSGRGSRGRSSRSEAEKEQRVAFVVNILLFQKWNQSKVLNCAKSMIYSLWYSATHLP